MSPKKIHKWLIPSEKMLNITAIKKMQIKTTNKYSFTPSRMALSAGHCTP